MILYLHFNKPGSQKGYPWTIHTSKGCIPAKEVVIHTTVITVFKKNKRSNPRAFLRISGDYTEFASGRYVIR